VINNAARRRSSLAALYVSGALALGTLVLSGAQSAHAFPAFAMKEHKPCGYCHINPRGGGKRNANGQWYQKHNFTFAGTGYTRAAAAKAAGVPIADVPVAPGEATTASKPGTKSTAGVPKKSMTTKRGVGQKPNASHKN